MKAALITLPCGVLVYPPRPAPALPPARPPNRFRSLLEALPSDAATCTPERLSTSVSSALAWRVCKPPPTAATARPRPPPISPPSTPPMLPALSLLKTTSGDRP